MTPEQWVTVVVVPILAALLTYFGVRVTSRRSLTVGREANAVTFSRDLLTRVSALEDDVLELRGQLEALKGVVSHATGWIEHCLRWITGGRVGPPPKITDTLAEHLNPWVVEDFRKAMFEEHPHDNSQPPTAGPDAGAR
jgi:hypothetical protein